MVSYSQKSRIRRIVILFLGGITATLIATLTVNTVLFLSRKSLLRSLQRYFPGSVSVGSFVYTPPWYVVVKDVTLSDSSGQSKKTVLRIPSIQTKISLLRLIAARQVFVSHISVMRPRADAYGFVSFLRDHHEQLVDIIKQLPRQNIKFLVKDFILALGGGQEDSSYFDCDAKLIFKNDWVYASGLIRQYSASGQGLPLRYKAKGFLTRDGINVSKFEVTRANFYSQVWGSLKGSHLRWNGFLFMNTAFQEADYQEPGFDIVEEIRNYLVRLRSTQADIVLPRANLYILDIDCQSTLAFPAVQIDKMNFSLNNNPMSVKGSIAFNDPIALDLHSSAYLTPFGEAMGENLKRIDAAIKGTIEERMVKGEGLLSFNFVSKEKGSTPLQKAEVSLEALRISFEKYPNLKMGARDINLFFRTDSNEYRIYLKDLQVFLYLAKERFKFASFKSQFYDGALHGVGRIDTQTFPPRINALARIQNVSANKLGGMLIHFSKVFGKLDSLMYFSSHPRLDLEGRMKVHQGYLKNFEFFKWLAGFLSLEALKKIDFDQASANFSVNSEGASLHEIRLDSKEVGMGGHFTLGAKDMVSSKLSLQCSKELLRESPKFAPLVRLVEADVSHLNFDFQLSGNLNNMNFQWLQSDFKRKLQKAIPNFIERRIEKNIEDLVESIPAR